MSANGGSFVEWEEQFVSQERGNRVVHYFLKNSTGDSFLAVVGTERSLRHMVYVVSDEFLQVYGSEKSNIACFKWRSKREVVDWLTSLLSKQNCTRDHSSQLIVEGDFINALLGSSSWAPWIDSFVQMKFGLGFFVWFGLWIGSS